jgi:hypothetical protein
MHQHVRALHTTNRMLDKDADVAQGFMHCLLRSAEGWLRVLWTLTRLLLRNVKLIKMGIRLQTLIASINPNMQVATPIHCWWDLLWQPLVIMSMATQGPTEHNEQRAWEGHHRVLQRMLFFPHWNAPVVWPHRVTDARRVPSRP